MTDTKFIKGQSGNPSGRPKSIKLTTAQRELFKDDPKKALIWLMNTAEDRRELLAVARLVIDYCAPKLSAIKQEVIEDRTLTLRWIGMDKPVLDLEYSEVLNEAQEQATKQIEDMAKTTLNEIASQVFDDWAKDD